MHPDFYISDDRTTVVASREFTNAGIILQEMNFLFELADVNLSYAPLAILLPDFSLSPYQSPPDAHQPLAEYVIRFKALGIFL